MQMQGQFKQADYYDNVGGLNLTDSPFKVDNGQATGGVNYSYLQTGGIRKRKGHLALNTVADTQLRTLGMGLYNTSAGTKATIRAAGTKIQNFNSSTLAFTNLSDDTATPATDIITSGATKSVVFSQFNTPSINTLWVAGADLTSLYGVYSSSKLTQNGSAAPTGTVTVTVNAAAGGTFASAGTYRYAFALRKAGTQALSNVGADTTATLANTTDTVTIPLASLTGIDATKYDRIYIYRSAVAGAAGFTTGDLVTTVATGTASYTDTGTSTSSSQNVPRSGNTLLDNGVLASGTYNCVTTYKQRLVTANGSSLYFSDINKPESWPAANTLNVPSGGPITALSIISFTSIGSNTIDEILVVFKERELWVVTGSSISDWALKFIDTTGCPNQALIVTANGYLAWMDYRGVYLWSGTSKPIYCSRLIEPLFAQDGDIDKSKMYFGVGQFYRKQNIIVWSLSHKIYGEQKLQLKLDLRLTIPSAQEGLEGAMLDAVFLQDTGAFGVYGLLSYLPSTPDEVLLMGDAAGFIYSGFAAESDGTSAIQFSYATKFLDLGNANQDKRFTTVIVWVEEIGTWDLKLDWWTNYSSAELQKSTRALPVSEIEPSALAVWDVAYWDLAAWDDYTPKLKPLYFNLVSDENNNSEGKCIRLQFRQDGVDQPVTISGFSVLYSDKGMAK